VVALIKKFCAGPVNSTLWQVPRALAASVISSTLDFFVLVALVELLHWHPVPASVVGYLAGGVLQYYLCSIWVFPSGPGNFASGYVAFTALSFLGLGITWLTMSVLNDTWHVNYQLSKIVALIFSFAWNFTSRKIFLFKPATS
jgi:putative flippase GtrA